MVKKKGLTNSAQPENTSSAGPGGDLVAKMDLILGAIQRYDGKGHTTMKMMLGIQKIFEEKLEALKQKNSAIKAQLNNQDDENEKDDNSKDFEEKEEKFKKNNNNKYQKIEENKEHAKDKKNEISNIASSCTKERRKSHVREKKNTKVTSKEILIEERVKKKTLNRRSE